MPKIDLNITKRFIEFGQSKFGNDFGWQATYARKLGISPQQMSNIIAGRSIVGEPIQLRLIRIMGCDIEWLMTGKKANNPHNLSVRESASSYGIDEKDKRIKELELLLKEKDETIEKLLRESVPDIVKLLLEKIKITGGVRPKN